MEQKYYRFEKTSLNYLEGDSKKVPEPNKPDNLKISHPRKFENGFVLYEDCKKDAKEDFPLHINNALAELEEKMFGIYRPEVQE